MAARKLRSQNMAIVIGKTIHLHNTTAAEFLANTCWVRHELVHIRQFRTHGFLPFVAKYLWESLWHGYRRNKYEIEARLGEQDTTICAEFGITGRPSGKHLGE